MQISSDSVDDSGDVDARADAVAADNDDDKPFVGDVECFCCCCCCLLSAFDDSNILETRSAAISYEKREEKSHFNIRVNMAGG